MELMGVWCMDLQSSLLSPMVQQYPVRSGLCPLEGQVLEPNEPGLQHLLVWSAQILPWIRCRGIG